MSIPSLTPSALRSYQRRYCLCIANRVLVFASVDKVVTRVKNYNRIVVIVTVSLLLPQYELTPGPFSACADQTNRR